MVAHDGEEAVRRAQESRPDLVLIDVGMPGMNGLEACRHIKRSLGVPIIGLSGYASNEDAKLAGMDYFYRKPWDPELLCAMIEGLEKSGNSPEASANLEVRF